VKSPKPQLAAHDQEVVDRVLIYYTEIGTSYFIFFNEYYLTDPTLVRVTQPWYLSAIQCYKNYYIQVLFNAT